MHSLALEAWHARLELTAHHSKSLPTLRTLKRIEFSLYQLLLRDSLSK
jgi:hypothetical protein